MLDNLLVRSQGAEFTRTCRDREKCGKINKLLQADANHLPFPVHFFFTILRRFANSCMTLL
jgi:hypothetical protein